jgi:hypothetical protein
MGVKTGELHEEHGNGRPGRHAASPTRSTLTTSRTSPVPGLLALHVREMGWRTISSRTALRASGEKSRVRACP